MTHDPERLANRYQNQPWHIKLWRLRYKLKVPYIAARIYWRHNRFVVPYTDSYTWLNCWSIAQGLTDGDMQHWYTSEEVWSGIDEGSD